MFKISNEGFDYTFNGYSNWYEIKNAKFHELRKEYIESKAKFQKFCEDMATMLNIEEYE